jgi:hypothetical protein
MDYLDNKGLIAHATRKDILGGHLVLIAPASSNVQIKIAPHFDLIGALVGGRLSVTDPDSVPAGEYAKTALTALARRLATLSPTPHWRDVVMGSCQDKPACDEVMALGRACRASEPSPDAARHGGTAGPVWQRPAPPSCGGQGAPSRRRPHRPLRVQLAGAGPGDRAPWPAVSGPGDQEAYRDHC